MQSQSQLTEARPLFQPKTSALAVMAGRFSVEPEKLLSTLKNTVFKGASNDELLALVVVANEYGLNPLTKEIYAFPAKGGGIVPVVSVDGWNNLANSRPEMDGMEFEFAHDDAGKLVSCTCVIHRKDRSKPVKVTEYLSECKRATEPWKMEHRMLRHKALIQCVRIAFGFSGVYDEEDAKTVAARVIDVQPANVPGNHPAASGPDDLGGSSGVYDAAPAGGRRSGQPTKPKTKAAAPPLTLESEAVSLFDQLQGRMKASQLTWPQVEKVAIEGGILNEPVSFDQIADVDLTALLHGWSAIVETINAGGGL